MEEHNDEINALIELFSGLKRQGPGDASFSKHMLSLLPALPENPRIADLGSGAGVGTLILAKWFNTKITAVDFSRPFLDELESHARNLGLDHLVRTMEADMGNLHWPDASIDLLWSEGAAYNLTFEGALKTWRPLMALGGIAVVSEMSLFADEIPGPALKFWQEAYPEIADENENSRRAGQAGFKVFGIHRLPSEAWWKNFYNPLIERMNTLRQDADPMMQEVLEETDLEIELFREYSDTYGYSVYVLKAV